MNNKFMSKINIIFNELIKLECCRFDESVLEYIKIVGLDAVNFSAFIVANKEGLSKVKDLFNKLNVNCTIVKTSETDENNVCNFKILDIDI